MSVAMTQQPDDLGVRPEVDFSRFVILGGSGYLAINWLYMYRFITLVRGHIAHL